MSRKRRFYEGDINRRENKHKIKNRTIEFKNLIKSKKNCIVKYHTLNQLNVSKENCNLLHKTSQEGDKYTE